MIATGDNKEEISRLKGFVLKKIKKFTSIIVTSITKDQNRLNLVADSSSSVAHSRTYLLLQGEFLYYRER